MALSDVDVERFARQIVIPGVGAEGQERLLGSTVLVDGFPRGVARAQRYLEASGIRVVTDDREAEIDCVLVAGIEIVGPGIEALVALARPLVWYRIRGAGLEAGIHLPAHDALELSRAAAARAAPSPREELLHDVAACDAVGSVISVLLDWQPLQLRHEAGLA
jgi:hypothetical protein